MAESSLIRNQLNSLAENKVSATVRGASFGWATLCRYEPLLQQVGAEINNKEKFDSWLAQGGCYVFEIGRNNGDVFSVNMVDSIEVTSSGAIIHLKR